MALRQIRLENDPILRKKSLEKYWLILAIVLIVAALAIYFISKNKTRD